MNCFHCFWLLPLGVATVAHLDPSHLIPRILLCHPNPLHIHLDYIHDMCVIALSFLPASHFHIHYVMEYNIFSIPPLHMSRVSQPYL